MMGLLVLVVFLHVIQLAFASTALGSKKLLTKDESCQDKNEFRAVLQHAAREGKSGAIACAIQVITMMWLRTAINYQHRYGVSLKIALKELYKQGGIARFYQGLSFALLQGPLARFGSIAANDVAILLGNSYNIQSNSRLAIVSTSLGSILSALWRIFLMPLDTCKTVLQVDGYEGFTLFSEKVLNGDFMLLYQGTLATLLATIAAHYPWFFVYNFLDASWVINNSKPYLLHLRNAIIGFLASMASDTVSNFIRVIKTVKQANRGVHLTYIDTVNKIVNDSGYLGLFGRGLLTRIISNGIQSMLFTVLWKCFVQKSTTKGRKVSSKVSFSKKRQI